LSNSTAVSVSEGDSNVQYDVATNSNPDEESNVTSSSVCCFKNPCFNQIKDHISGFTGFLHTHATIIKRVIYAILVAGYAAYFAYALNYEFGSESSIRLLWVTMTCVFFFFISLVRSQWGEKIEKYILEPVVKFIMKRWMIFKV